MTNPQYQLGDIANGHRLTEQPDGSKAWIPLAPDYQYQTGDVANDHRLTEQPDGSKAWLPVHTTPISNTATATTEYIPAVGPSTPSQPASTQYMPSIGSPSQPAFLTGADAKKSGFEGWSNRKKLILFGSLGAVLALIITIGTISEKNAPAPVAASSEPTEDAEPAAEPEPAPEPEMVAVPTNLVGMTANDAYNALTAVGLEAIYDGEPTAKVLSVSPVATEVEVGSTITLTVEQPPVLSLGQQNAVDTGLSYLAYSGFSRASLIDQLEFEGFSTADATFAVDHIAPDWNAEAAESAQSYMDYSSFSRQSLIDQLIFEGFTSEQAAFGAAAVGY